MIAGRIVRVVSRCWAWAAAAVLLLTIAGCGDGGPSSGRERWGYDPWEPTGKTDPPVPERDLPDGYHIEQVVTGLELPTQMAATPDGRLLIAEQRGTVRVVQDGRLLDEPFVTVPAYTPEEPREHGLVGITIAPDFEENGDVYLYYDVDSPRRTMLARVRDEAGRGVGLQQIRSWQGTFGCCHLGGGMEFGPDGMLYVAVGDHDRVGEAQNPSNQFGAIIRLNPNGSAPEDNPFPGPVYAYGFRNPYDVAIDPETGRIFTGENGLFGQDAVVEVKRGANYGWPGFALAAPQEEIEPPLIFFHTFAGLAGMEFYTADALPEFKGDLFFCGFHDATLRRVEFRPDGSVEEQSIIARTCTTDVAMGPDGFLYFLDFIEGTLYRIAAGEP